MSAPAAFDYAIVRVVPSVERGECLNVGVILFCRARRFLDAELLQYALRAIDEKGRGPMVVCIDGSSSMAGDKEIWSKAVSLTLLDIAQRQRRLFRSICFAAADTPLQILDLNQRQRYAAEIARICGTDATPVG